MEGVRMQTQVKFMKKSGKNIQEQILFYARKLPSIKQLEALDFIKWLWGGPGKSEEFTPSEIDKIEQLGKKRGGKKFSHWESAKKYLQSL